tara:strand:+ start:281 stop:1012 length:732 start_codon:yes stop_codon:yes gene_type:complete
MKKIGICLPSFNESKNIVNLINDILKINNEIDICVVDDNSPDNTFGLLQNKFKNKENIHLIKREKKNGRGSAVWEGFNFLKNSGRKIEIFIEMDCDFSHSVDDLFKGIKILSNNIDCDVLLGSRYPDGVIINWPLKRRIFSYSSNLLIRFLISKSIQDYTNGFRFYNYKAINQILKNKPMNKGFIYLTETLANFLSNDFKIMSFPIIFENRIRGESNTNLKEIFNSLKGLFLISIKFLSKKFN